MHITSKWIGVLQCKKIDEVPNTPSIKKDPEDPDGGYVTEEDEGMEGDRSKKNNKRVCIVEVRWQLSLVVDQI